MTVAHPHALAPRRSRLIHRAWRVNQLLTLTTILYVLLIPLPLIGMLLDPKVITGVNGWMKPLKFLISAAIYNATFLWLLTYVHGRRRLVQIIATGTGLMLLLEIVLITLQVFRNTTSHFNVSTPLDAAIFSTMGTAITLLAIMNLMLAIVLIRRRMDNRVFAWGLRLGVLASFMGMMVAFLMTAGPTPAQLAALEAGAPPTVVGGHSVGVADGGPGLPLGGWSMIGGDLRVPHFVGLHGMQMLALLGWALSRPAARHRWRETHRLALVWIGGLTYMAWILLLTWQALRGQSIVMPDGQTWFAYGLLLASAGAATLVTLVGFRPTSSLTAANGD